jgi:uncharacterized protein YgbK (DUF1537 family)
MSEETIRSHHHEAYRTILIIADDLTGAADSAVQFRQAGFSAVAFARPARSHVSWHRAPVVSLSLNTRDASPSAVRRIWERHAPTIRMLARGALVYQKIDSTLRGHPALEVRLLLGHLGVAAAIIAPAFPKLGRHTVDGVHRVDGVPLAETGYARTQTRTRLTSALPELFSAGGNQWPSHLPLSVIEGGAEVVVPWLQKRLDEPGRLITVDAAEERHLDILTQAVLPHAGRVLLVGSAGWAERLAMACKGWLAETQPRPGVLGVVGSLSSVATRQVQAASHAGVTVAQPLSPMAHATADATLSARHPVIQALTSGRSAILWTNPGEMSAGSRPAGQRVLRALANIVRDILSTTPVSGLAIVGGDTAHALFRALRASGLVLVGEVAPGMPYGRLLGGPYAGLPTATKAGGFGGDTALDECLQFLHHWGAQ